MTRKLIFTELLIAVREPVCVRVDVQIDMCVLI